MSKIALYPGTFDPITNGHIDIIKRATRLFDTLIVAVAKSSEKNPMFSLDTRVKMAKEATKNMSNIQVVGFDNLTVDLAKSVNAAVLIRGLRAVSDFEFELQIGYLNHSLDDTLETVYLMPSLKNAFISSSIIRNLIKFNGKTTHLVPQEIQYLLKGN